MQAPATPGGKQLVVPQVVGGHGVKRRRHRESWAAKRKARASTKAKVDLWRENHTKRAEFTTTQSSAIALPHSLPGFIGLRDSRPGCPEVPYVPAPGYKYIESVAG